MIDRFVGAVICKKNHHLGYGIPWGQLRDRLQSREEEEVLLGFASQSASWWQRQMVEKCPFVFVV